LSDQEVPRLICRAMDERIEIEAELRKTGRLLVTEKGYPVVNPLLTELRKLDAQITTWLSLCGLTAVDRSARGFAEVERGAKGKLYSLRDRRRMAAGASVAPEVAEPD